MESQPKFTLFKRTNTRGAYLFSVLMTIFWIFMTVIIMLQAKKLSEPPNKSEFIGFHIFIGLIVILPIVFGFLRKKVILIFKIDHQKNMLVIESHWGNYCTFSKSYALNKIKGFEVHYVYGNKREVRNQITKNQLLALCFKF
ncbi:MAG: hypothetical protein ACTSWX_13120 [Promethearchaeota archaeon]